MEKTRLYTELALVLALAVVLDMLSKMLPIPRMPYGGSISLRALPILIIAFKHGGKIGMFAGAIYGLIDCMLQPIIVHPMQFFLDYPVAFAGLGLAGLFRRQNRLGTRHLDRSHLCLVCGVFLGYSVRFLGHFMSGFIFFGHYAPEGQPIWLYSFLYNISYLVPESIIAILLTPFILARLPLGESATA